MKAVILAGGKGTRLAPYTRVFPKPMLPIGDKTILEIMLLQMKRAGVQDVILTVGHMAGLMRAFFQDGSQYGLRISYSYEKEPLGTAGPLAMLEGLDDTFLVANGDVLTTLAIPELVAYHKDKGAAATIASHCRTVKIDLGVIETNGDGVVTNYLEKPQSEYLVSMGLYVFEPRVLSYIPRGAYLDFPDLVKQLIAAGETVAAYPYSDYWKDLGRPDDYEEAVQDFEAMRADFLPGED